MPGLCSCSDQRCAELVADFLLRLQRHGQWCDFLDAPAQPVDGGMQAVVGVGGVGMAQQAAEMVAADHVAASL